MKREPHFTYKYADEWEEIRSNWVNGNRGDVRQMLRECSRNCLFRIISSALNYAYEFDNGDTHSGALIDLKEVFNSLG